MGYVLSVVMGLVCVFYSFILIAYTPYALKANIPLLGQKCGKIPVENPKKLT